jgi:hypothetical protein
MALFFLGKGSGSQDEPLSCFGGLPLDKGLETPQFGNQWICDSRNRSRCAVLSFFDLLTSQAIGGVIQLSPWRSIFILKRRC